MFYIALHRTKGAPVVGAQGPGHSGPFSPWPGDDDTDPPAGAPGDEEAAATPGEGVTAAGPDRTQGQSASALRLSIASLTPARV